MKKLISILMLAIFCASLAACQPTPDKPFVQSKNDGVLQDAIYASTDPVDSVPYEAPETWVETVEGADGIAFINVDAKLTVPDVTAYPVYRVTSTDITDEDIAVFINALAGDKPVCMIDHPRTKKFLQIEMDRRLSEFEDPNSSINRALAAGEISQEEYDYELNNANKHVAELQKEFKSAPDDVEYTVLEKKFQRELLPETNELSNIKTLFGFIVNDDETVVNAVNFWSEVQQPFGRDQFKYFQSRFDILTYQQGAMVGMYGQASDGMRLLQMPDKLSCKMSYDDAKSFADEIIHDKLGHDDYTVNRVCTAYGAKSYIFIYTRTIDGIPMLHYSMDTLEATGEDNADYYYAIYPHCMYVEVADKDDYCVYEQSTLEIKECLNENVKLMPFEEIQDIFRKQIAMHQDTSDLFGGTDENGETVVERATYNITDIRLGYVRIIEKDNIENGLLVPVWAFYGQQVNTYKEGSNPCWALNENGEKVFDNDAGNAFICINAIDGSIINLDKGF